MRVRINENCICCGVCVDTCPEVFELTDDTVVIKLNPIPEDLEESVKEAEEACPVEAIETE